ncbi:MAG: T9SS type A sorting domain-containing protein [Bacteroidia bacterium]|nr:T9SS type A sorting domain-containing protein [Bacteroidia bacterium]
MKKTLLLLIAGWIGTGVSAQQSPRLPQGFHTAVVPQYYKNHGVPLVKHSPYLDNGIPVNNIQSRMWATPHTIQSTTVNEQIIGYTYYDLQTNGTISNRLVKNADGTFSACWTFSPQDASGLFPNRGTGYNYYDPNNGGWFFTPTGPGGDYPNARIETARTGFTNIAVTESGREISISHSGTNMTQTTRPSKGTGAWAFNDTIFGTANNDTWPKAIAGGANGETIHAIWQGSGTAGTLTNGQDGPLYYSRSTDGGVTYPVMKRIIDLVDSTQYYGFGADAYSIDVKGNTVAIVYCDFTTDVGLLKSTDGGDNWTKTIIQTFPIPLMTPTTLSDTNSDGIADTLLSNSGDAHVLIDNNGLCHVWFGANRVIGDGTGVFYFPGTDGLFYWNETMPTDGYVLIAGAQDYNGNGVLDIPQDPTCTFPWGNYRGGLTQMPCAGIDGAGTLYVTYQTVVEAPGADTALYHQMHRHIFMITSSDNGFTWTYPFDIVPSAAQGGDGENQEAVFACIARNVDANAYVLYQRDFAPGHALAAAGSCDLANNLGNPSDIVFAEVEAATVKVNTVPFDNIAVSQNYPNPAHGTTSIDINLKKGSGINIEIVDVLGRTVYSKVLSNASAGKHTLYIDTSNWSNGLYSYTVRTEGASVSKSMLVQ